VRAFVLVIADVASIASDVCSALLAFALARLGVEALFVRPGVALDVSKASRCAALRRLLLADSQTTTIYILFYFNDDDDDDDDG